MKTAKNIYELMKSVVVIESAFNGTVFNVATRNMLQIYPTDVNPVEGSWHLTSGVNPEMREWEIVRLFKE